MPDRDPFAELARDVAPPAALRAKVQADLTRRGLLRPRGSAWRASAMLAAAFALFLGGLWTGARGRAAPEPSVAAGTQQFALLLYEPVGFDTTLSHEVLAREYGAWAASLESRFVSGEALGDQRVLGGSDAEVGARTPTGYFIVRAARWEDAMEIARQCPHLRHGGVVAVREIIT